MGTQLPPVKRAQPHQIFGPWIKMPFGTKVNLGPGDVVLDGSQLPLKGAQPQFSANVYCDQTAGWMKMPVATEVDLGPGHIVLPSSPSHAKGTQQPPLFSAYVYCGHGRLSQLLLSSCCSFLYDDGIHVGENFKCRRSTS